MSVARTLSRSFIALAFILFAAFSARAQYRAGIQGSVLDSQGAAVSGATLTVTAQETGVSQQTTTDDNGVYSVNRLAPGPYTIAAEKSGFKKKTIQDLTIIADQITALNITLEVGQVSESVTVNASELPPIDTESGANQRHGHQPTDPAIALVWPRRLPARATRARGIRRRRPSWWRRIRTASRHECRSVQLDRRHFQNRECSTDYR